MRRNVDLNIILFNNRIYGLTKGQYSPTSLPGKVTATSPMGSIEHAFNATSVAIGAEASFIARAVDRNTKHMAEILRQACEHKGTSFVEIYQNCNIYNDGAWTNFTEANVRDDNTLMLEHDQPMIFGKDRDKGIRLDGLTPEVVTLGNGISESDLLSHDESTEQPALAYLLSRMEYPEFPVPLGVFRSIERPTYEEQVLEQCHKAAEQNGEGDLTALYHASDTWIVAEGVDDQKPEESRRVLSEGEHIPDAIIPSIDEEDPLAPKTELQHLINDPVGSLDLPEPQCISPDTSLEAAIDIITEKNAGCLLVVDGNNKLLGIFAQGDVFSKVAAQDVDLKNTTVGSLMTADPTTLRRSAPIGHVLHLMALHGFRHIPIVDRDNRPVGLASFKEILKFTGGLFASSDGNGST